VTPPRQLPFYVEPLPGEALPSWLTRLALRLGVPMPVLLPHLLSPEMPTTPPHWWQRLHPWQIHRMAQLTGVSVARVREMTFIDWAAPCRNDEAPERFSAVRWRARYRDPSTCHFAVCPQCVVEDAEPYLRLDWTIGWIAVCEPHGLALITRCPHCRSRLRLPSPFSRRTFSASLCSDCRKPLSLARRVPAHRRALHLQAALIAAHRSGSCELSLLGSMSWPDLLVLIDSVLKIFWLAIPRADRDRLFGWVQYDLSLPQSKDHGRWHERYESLGLLAWLLQVPRYSTGARLTAHDLTHWIAHHAYPVLDPEGRALLNTEAMPPALKARLADLISMFSPFRYMGQVALRSGISGPDRPPPSSGRGPFSDSASV